jgi:predicted small secreted protein
MRRAITSFVILLTCALMAGCTNTPKTNAEKIDHLKQQVANDAATLQDLDNKDFATLQKDFIHCDSMLQYLPQEEVEANFEHLNLTQAYLAQFSEVKPVMERKMNYVVEQLDNLKADAESHYLSDSLVNVYLETETRVADTLHAQVEYFQERFASCQKALNQMKKSK